MKYRSEDMIIAYKKGGCRERYAMQNGNKSIIYVRGHKCFKFTYSKDLDYQDANGAVYDTVYRIWIN